MRIPLHSCAVLATASLLPAQLAGPYTVGPGGNYANLTAAIADLTTLGVAAPVTFVVTANDVGPWTLPPFSGQGAANPVVFEGLGLATLSGAQPILTLNGCASVTFQGFTGTFTSSANAIVVNGATADCTFRTCTFTAPAATTGAALFNFSGGSGCRIEESTFGGSYEAINVGVANTGTTIERCDITGGGWWIMRLAGADCSLVDNMITGNSNYGISCGISGTPTSGANLKVLHNSICIAHPTASNQYCALRWYSNAAGTEVRDNVLCNLFTTSATLSFNLWCSGSYRPALMDNNCFWSNLAGYSPVYAGANRTLAQWQSLGFDANSLQADPQFVAPTATPPDLHLQPGSPCSTAGQFVPTVLFDRYLAPRTAPVSIGAHEEDSGASYTVFGAGCAGTAGIATNTASSPPRLGLTSTITYGNLPSPYVAVAILGLSNSLSGFGPLPLDLGFLGAPGCSLRVSLDATLGLLGASGTASFQFPIPSTPTLLGFVFHTQAGVFDAAANAFGLVLSDAATATVGL